MTAATLSDASDTLSYSYSYRSNRDTYTASKSFTVYFVDTSGNTLSSAVISADSSPYTFDGTENNSYLTLSTLASNYTVTVDSAAWYYQSARVSTGTYSSGTAAEYIRYNGNGGNSGWQYGTTGNNSNISWTGMSNMSYIYLIYSETESSGDSSGEYSGYTVDHIDLSLYPTASLTINGKEYTTTITLSNSDFYDDDGNPTDTWGLTAFDSSNNYYTYIVDGMNASGSSGSDGVAQVRFEGEFPIGTLSDPIYYTFWFTTSVTFSDSNTGASYTVVMTFYDTFSYWDSDNNCPGLPNNWSTTTNKTYQGSGSGMDFTISAEMTGGSISIIKEVRDSETKALLAIEDTDYKIYLYDATENDGNTSNDVLEQTATLTVASSGMASVLYNIDVGDYYVVEDTPATSVTTTDGTEMNYVSTSTYYVLTTYDSNGDVTATTTSKALTDLTSDKAETDSVTSVTFYVVNYYGEETVDIPVEKVWDDDDDYYGLRPDDVTVYLYAGGDPVTEDDGETAVGLTLSESNSWAGTFEDLPKYDDDNNEIVYTVAEESNLPSAYTSSVSGDITEGYTITNTLETASLTLNKKVNADSSIITSDILADLTFTFTVTGTNGELAKLESVADSNGNYWSVSGGVTKVTVPANGSVTLVDLPAGTYTVAETSSTITVDGYQYQWTVSGEDDVDVTAEDEAGITITNTITGTARLILYKYWVDESNAYYTRPDNDGEEFVVTITATNATDGKTYTYSTTGYTWDESSNTWTLVFDGVAAYDEKGVALTYEISENSGTADLSAYTFSGDATVTPAADRNVELTNTLKTTTVTVKKVVTEEDGTVLTTTDNQDNFRFALYTYVDEDGDGVVETAVSIGTSTISAGGTATFNEVPIGTLYLTEYLVGSHAHSYDTTVSVSGTGVSNVSNVKESYAYDSTESAYVKYHTVSFDVDGTGATVSVTVTNVEESVSVSLATLINGTKTFTGTDSATKTFNYTVNQSMENANADEDAGETVATGTVTVSTGDTNKAITWTIVQENAFVYTEVGTYTYVIYEEEETGTGSGGVVYDSTRYTLTVVVSKDDSNGELIATVSMTKNVENEDGTRTTSNVKSDTNSYTSFIAASTHSDNENVKDDTFTASFVNTYDASETSIILRATKTLVGRSLAEGEFTIEIQELDEGGEAIGDPVYRSNGSTGAFGYEIIFDTAGTYWYKVSEEAGTFDYVTYDTHYYIVTVVVEDVDGVLTVKETETTYYDANGRTQLGSTATYNSMFFRNYYSAKGEATLSAYKVLDGRDFSDDDEFTFMIEALDSSAPFVDESEYDVLTNSSGNRYITVTMTGAKLKALKSYYVNDDKTVAMSLMELVTFALDQDDVGSWEYRVTEVAPSGATENADGTYTLDDLTYDTQTYGHLITLTVTDNGNGTLSAKTSSTNDTDWNGDDVVDTSSAVIVNTFDAGIVDIYGRKTWVDGGATHTTNKDDVTLTLYYTTDTEITDSTAWKEYTDSYTVNWGTLYTNDWDILNLPQYDSSGNKITYKVVEENINGYTTTYSNGSEVYTDDYSSSDRFIITNTLEQKYVTLTGTKTWVDGGLDHNNETEITLTVTRNSESTSLTTLTQVEYPGTSVDGTYIVDWNGDVYSIYWYYDADAGEYVGLPKYDDSRYEYYYSVAETLSKTLEYNYTSSLEKDVDNYTFNFTNTRDAEDPEVTKEETTVNEGNATLDAISGYYDEVSVGDIITYEIDWYNGNNTEATVTITDPLDTGVDFVSASYGSLTLAAADTDEATGTDVTISYDADTHTVTWTIEADPFESGIVTLVVEVNENAKQVTTETTATVDNQATMTVTTTEENVYSTEIITNPLEDDEETAPTKGLVSVYDSNKEVNVTARDESGNLYVSVGDIVTYQIGYYNNTNSTATIYIIDTLDTGVTYRGANRNGVYYEDGTTIEIDGTEIVVPARSVLWTLTVSAFTGGYVRLYVTVNEDATAAENDYEVNGDGSLTYGTEDDTTASIANQATVYIGNSTASYTEVVEDPLEPEDKTEPEKTETNKELVDSSTDENTGTRTDEYEAVSIGAVITYEISYYNHNNTQATVTITDELDDDVSVVEGTISDNGVYDEEAHTITWTLTVDPLTAGTVSFQVQVLSTAVTEGSTENTVENQATVTVSTGDVENDVTQDTNIVENPVDDNPENPTKAVAASSAGASGANVSVGDEITYVIGYYNNYSKEKTVNIYDYLDDNVSFVSATDQNGDILDESVYDSTEHKVTWPEFTAAAYETGTVTVTVKVEDGAQKSTVKNTAWVQIGNNSYVETNEVTNPVDDDPEDPTKTETAINGKAVEAVSTDTDGTTNYEAVSVGDEITYTITYYNYYAVETDITITDQLDSGVEFVSATDRDGKELTADDVFESNDDTYVKWPVFTAEAYESGSVTLTVRVTEDAKTAGDGLSSEWADSTTVDNQASVQIGNDSAATTNIVTNPLTPDDPENPSKAIYYVEDEEGNVQTKTDGKNLYVSVGDKVTYTISYYNHNSTPATVTITDTLDDGVDFVSATDGNGNVVNKATAVAGTGTVVYDETNHTVTWTIENASPFTEGSVTLTVRVNDDAKTANQTYSAVDPTDPDVYYEFTYTEVASIANQAAVTIVANTSDTDTETDPEETEEPAYTNVPENPLESEDPVNPTKTISATSPSGYDADATINETTNTLTGSSVGIGSMITYVISYYNYNNTAADVTITDKLDAGVTYLDSSDNGVYDEATHTVTWTLENVTPLTEGTVTLAVQVNENAWIVGDDETTATVENTASVAINNDAAVDTNKVENPIDPDDPGDPEKAVSADSEAGVNGSAVNHGDQITYTIAYYNHTNTAVNVIIMDELDDGVDYVSSSNSGVYDEEDHTVTWTFEDVDAFTGGYVTLTVKVNSSTGETVENDADVYIGGNSATTNLVTNPVNDDPVDPVKTVEIDDNDGTTDDGDLVAVGDELVYTITYYNYLSYAATVIITDELDEGVDYVKSDNGGVYDSDIHTVTWTLEGVNAYTEGSVTLTVKVNENAKTLDTGDTTASVVNDALVEIGKDVGNTYSRMTNEVENPIESDAPVDPTKTVAVGSGNSVAVGDELVYTISYYNYNNTAATVTITDALDAGVDYVSSSPAGVYDTASHTVTWTLANVEAFTSGTVTLTVQVNRDATILADGETEGDVVNTASVQIGNAAAVDTNKVENPVPVEISEDATVTVTKTLTWDGVEITAEDYTFYVALYADEDCTTRMTEVKALTFENSASESVTFTGLEIGRTYYVSECEEDGTAILSGTISDGTLFAVTFDNDENSVTIADGMAAEITFENQFVEIPTGFYVQGYLTITKILLDADGSALASDAVFYAGIFTDSSYTTLAENVSTNIVELDLAADGSEGSEVSVTIDVAAAGDEDTVLYVTEVEIDEDGNVVPVADDASFGYTVSYSGSEVTLTSTDTEATVTITNKEIEEEEETESESETETETDTEEAVQTGDETPLAQYFALLLLALAIIVAEMFYLRRRERGARD